MENVQRKIIDDLTFLSKKSEITLVKVAYNIAIQIVNENFEKSQINNVQPPNDMQCGVVTNPQVD